MIEYFPFVLSLSKHEFSFFSSLLGPRTRVEAPSLISSWEVKLCASGSVCFLRHC